MSAGSKRNRGPSAGPENRAALIQAAHQIFGERGYDAPLSAIARKAGVGQGSLYRHFPERALLARAVLEQNLAEIDALAENPETTLRDLLRLVTHQTENTAGLLNALTKSLPGDVGEELSRRLRELIESKWDQTDGMLGPNTTVEDVMLAINLAAGAVMQSPPELRHETTVHAWRLLERALAN